MARRLKILVVNGDDFGLSKGINQGIESALHRGVLRSASLMANGSAFDDAVQIALRNPDLGVGVHLSLVAERCVASVDDVRGLAADDGELPASYAAFVKAYLTKRFGVREIRAEVEAQLKRVIDAGIKPTHLDSHQHVHILPGFLEVVIDAAKSAGIEVVRVPLEPVSLTPSLISARGVQMLVLSMLAGSAGKKVRASGLKCADHFQGIAVSGHMTEPNLAQVVGDLGQGVNEIMCHPGFSDPDTAAKYVWNYSWDGEVAALCSENIRRQLDEGRIRLANFANAWIPED